MAGLVMSSLSLRVESTVPSTSASQSLPPGLAEYTMGGLSAQQALKQAPKCPSLGLLPTCTTSRVITFSSKQRDTVDTSNRF